MMAHARASHSQPESIFAFAPPSLARCFPSHRFLSFGLDHPSVCLAALSVTSRRREVGIRSREGHLGRVEASESPA